MKLNLMKQVNELCDMHQMETIQQYVQYDPTNGRLFIDLNNWTSASRVRLHLYYKWSSNNINYWRDLIVQHEGMKKKMNMKCAACITVYTYGTVPSK